MARRKGDTGAIVEAAPFLQLRKGAAFFRGEGFAGADLSGLNRNLDGAREVTKDENSSVDIYVSKALLDAIFNDKKMLDEHLVDAEKYNNSMPNFFPGLFRNRAITGQDTHVTDDSLDDMTYLDGRPILADPQPDFLKSDKNPFLQVLYHLVPLFKSASEIHDIQMKQYEKEHGSLSDAYTMLTLPGSFSRTYMSALIGTLDVTGWASNWNTYIKPSYLKRTGN